MPNADQRHCIEGVRPMKLLAGQNRFASVGEGHITLCCLGVTDFSRVGAGLRMAGAGLTTNSWHPPIYGFFLLRRRGVKTACRAMQSEELQLGRWRSRGWDEP